MHPSPFGVDRSDEIRQLFKLSVEEMVQKSRGRLVVKRTLEELYEFSAEYMVSEFHAGMTKKGPAAFIMPVGPVEPYPRMAKKINRDRIDLSNCWFFFMDEYCDDNDRPIPETHPLSFRRESRSLFFDRIDKDLLMPASHVVFPSPENLEVLPAMIESVGGIDVCYGGLGIHGHIAFNEPEVGVKDSNPRIVSLNNFTRTIDATRHGVGGNLINFPRRAITLGLRQILGSRKIFLMTRNAHAAMDWANTVLRIATLGKPGDDYPVTHIRGHGNYTLAVDYATASAPQTII
jgi:glucosamine-6-phosphate deaminase